MRISYCPPMAKGYGTKIGWFECSDAISVYLFLVVLPLLDSTGQIFVGRVSRPVLPSPFRLRMLRFLGRLFLCRVD